MCVQREERGVCVYTQWCKEDGENCRPDDGDFTIYVTWFVRQIELFGESALGGADNHGQVEESHGAQPVVQEAQEWNQEAEETTVLFDQRGT